VGIILPGGLSPVGAGQVVPASSGREWQPEVTREVQRAGIVDAFVREFQRARIVDAFVLEVGDRGLSGVNIPAVCSRASVSTAVFDEIFRGGFDCALAAFLIGSEIVCDLGDIVFRRTAGAWEIRLHAAMSAMLHLIASSPGFARLAIVDLRRHPEGAEHFGAVVSRCRKTFGGTATLRVPIGVDFDDHAYESVLVGGALGPIDNAVLEGRAAELLDLAGTVTFSLALPVVGRKRALRLICP
jgi:hypothetical protein